MKKILSLFVFALGCLTLASCSDDDFTEKVNSVTYSTESSTIPSVGGSVVFTVTGEGLTATSAADWLSVSLSGQTITATAGANPTRESRATHITVKASNGDTQLLSVVQAGVVVGIESYEINVTDAAATVALEYKADDAVSVRSLSEWITASVDAATNTVNINIAPNGEREARIGMVEFSSVSVVDTFYVNQDALVFEIENLNPSFASNEAGTIKVPVKHSKDVTVACESGWLTASFDAKENVIVLEATENTGYGRVATVTVSSGDVVEVMKVTQYDPASLGDQMLGSYYFLFVDEEGEEGGLYATLTENALELPALGWSIPVTIDKEKLTITINSGNFVGLFDYQGMPLYMYLLFVEETNQYWSGNSTEVVVTSTLGLMDLGDGELTLVGDFDGTLHGNKITDFLFSAMLDKTLDVNSDDYIGDLYQWSSVTLVKAPEEAEARMMQKRSMKVNKKPSILKKRFKK